MTKETIELLKNWTPGKFPFPGVMQEKFDGVPVIITRYGPGIAGLVPLTRQGEYVKSCTHILAEADSLLDYKGSFIVGELYDATIPFKTISGQVRDTKQQYPNLELRVFDGYLGSEAKQYLPWALRYSNISRSIREGNFFHIFPIPGRFVANAQQVDDEYAEFIRAHPRAEGVVLHSLGKQWTPGKRCWGTQRIKPQSTSDLLCIGFRQAVTEAGEPKGMVGACLYETGRTKNGKPVIDAFGPGCLTHSERTELWFQWMAGTYQPRVAEVKHMKDETYDALRQPTFLRWRPDKQVA